MYWGFKPYVPVARRKSLAADFVKKLAKRQRRDPAPVAAQMPKSIWGKAWADHLESFSDYANRLPRGRTYLRNGSVLDLVIGPKRIDAVVAGSRTYQVQIEISGLAKSRWAELRRECASGIDSILDLMAGRLSAAVMGRLVDPQKGIFPTPGEIEMSCSCPDWSSCCKHIAAVMYGVGTRLDTQPELLFVLRGVDYQQLVTGAMRSGALERELDRGAGQIAAEDLGAIFGIELDAQVADAEDAAPRRREAPSAAETAMRKTPRRSKSPRNTSPRIKSPAVTEPASLKKSTPGAPKSIKSTRNAEPADAEITAVSIPPELLQEMLVEAGFETSPEAPRDSQKSKKGRRAKVARPSRH